MDEDREMKFILDLMVTNISLSIHLFSAVCLWYKTLVLSENVNKKLVKMIKAQTPDTTVRYQSLVLARDSVGEDKPALYFLFCLLFTTVSTYWHLLDRLKTAGDTFVILDFGLCK